MQKLRTAVLEENRENEIWGWEIFFSRLYLSYEGEGSLFKNKPYKKLNCHIDQVVSENNCDTQTDIQLFLYKNKSY